MPKNFTGKFRAFFIIVFVLFMPPLRMYRHLTANFCFRFLDLCYKKLVLKKSNASDKCGFFRINRESVVPYTVKETIKYVPLFYFEGETDHLKLKSDKVDGWDLAYLKFCCKVQGIRNELFAADTCRVVALDEIKGHFPSGKYITF